MSDLLRACEIDADQVVDLPRLLQVEAVVNTFVRLVSPCGLLREIDAVRTSAERDWAGLAGGVVSMLGVAGFDQLEGEQRVLAGLRVSEVIGVIALGPGTVKDGHLIGLVVAQLAPAVVAAILERDGMAPLRALRAAEAIVGRHGFDLIADPLPAARSLH